MKTVDCRELQCPGPVLRARATLLEEPVEAFSVIVDNDTALQNVVRFLKSNGRTVSWKEKEGLYEIIAAAGRETAPARQTGSEPSPTRPAGAEFAELTATANSAGGEAVILLSADHMGRGDSELGQILMRSFIYTLTQRDTMPRALAMINSGVKLSLKGSAVAEELELLASRGVTILVCGTCLDYFELKDEHAYGEVSNMYDLADLLMEAGRFITV